MLKNSDYYLHDITKTNFSYNNAMAQLKSDGFVVIRGLFSKSLVQDTALRINEVMKQPSISGSYGYYRKDFAKLLFDPLLLSGQIVDLLVNNQVIDFVEQYLDGEVVIAECNVKHDLGVNQLYFPIHADFAPGWRQSTDEDAVVLSVADLKNPIAVGAMVYFHDTTDGAFCYAAGTQNIDKTPGPDLHNYPNDFQQDVISKLVRVEGMAGDLVLFDDRGFHGPEQPVKVSRTVLIFDYYKLKVFGGKTKVAFPALLSDLGHLSSKQLSTLGLGIDTMVPYKLNHVRSFNKTPYYPKLKDLLEKQFNRHKRLVAIKNFMRKLKCKIIK